MEISNQLSKSEDYHLDTSRISKSGLDLIRLSPAHYYDKYLNPDPYQIPVRQENKHFDIGEVFHTAMLEPHEYMKRYIVPQKKIDKRTKEGKADWLKVCAAAKGRKIINTDIHEWAMRMRDAAMSNPIVQQLFSSGFAERTCLFTEPDTGALCKCRPDWETGDGLLVDCKSTDDASPNGFRRSVEKFRYYVQDPFYRDGIFYERGFFPDAFIFIAVEKKPPFNVGLYCLDADAVEHGRHEYMKDVEIYLECKRTGHWHGYSPKIETIPVRIFRG